jgi:hypothetical protein
MTRLARRPCLWVASLGRIAFTAICAAAVFAAWRYVPRLPWMLFGASSIIVIAAACGIIVSLRMAARTPVVEIDHASLAYGDSAEVRVVSPGDVDVRLIGECEATKAVDISNFRDKHVSITRCYEEELIRGKGPFTVRVHIPKSAPADDVAWKIVVEAAGVAHPYPLRVV